MTNSQKSIDGIRIRPASVSIKAEGVTKHPPVMSKLAISLVVLGVSGIIIGLLFAMHYHRSIGSTPSILSTVESAVSKHYLLPTDEEPALATVTDMRKLSTPLFKQAHDGDKILIYQKNEIAIVYRPSIDRVVAVGPVSIDTLPAGKSK